MTVVIEGVPGYETLHGLIRRKVEMLSARLRVPPVTARIAFSDENGPKGGVDIRCTLTLEVPRRQALHVEHVADTPRRAFDVAFAGLERRLARELKQARDQRRRPKKYFAAKRLLESDAGPPEA
jgi:ribosome-associated translation inhibitor RaiA